jgi:ribonuclease-3
VRDRADSYERLEFLGDSVLQLLVTEALMSRHPGSSEGDLAWMRQQVVSGEVCARVARDAGLPAAMRDAAPDPAAAGLLAERTSVQAALTEAVIGAAWLDLPRPPTAEAVLAAFGEALEAAVPGHRDPKTALQELAARVGAGEVRYELVGTAGPAHQRVFTTRVTVGRHAAEGAGRSKQSSEQAAAAEALLMLGAD